jgi:hypothetical protein
MAKAEATATEKVYTEYAVVVFTDLASVVNDVKSLMVRGWQPIGGIAVSAQGTATYHYQAMAK